jgi:hypothetical protein
VRLLLGSSSLDGMGVALQGNRNLYVGRKRMSDNAVLAWKFVMSGLVTLGIMAMSVGVSYLTGDWRWMWMLLLLLITV